MKEKTENSIILEFEKEKETKGTVRYKELDVAEGDRACIGTIYLIKDVLPKPFPEKVKVTVEFE